MPDGRMPPTGLAGKRLLLSGAQAAADVRSCTGGRSDAAPAVSAPRAGVSQGCRMPSSLSCQH